MRVAKQTLPRARGCLRVPCAWSQQQPKALLGRTSFGAPARTRLLTSLTRCARPHPLSCLCVAKEWRDTLHATPRRAPHATRQRSCTQPCAFHSRPRSLRTFSPRLASHHAASGSSCCARSIRRRRTRQRPLPPRPRLALSLPPTRTLSATMTSTAASWSSTVRALRLTQRDRARADVAPLPLTL